MHSVHVVVVHVYACVRLCACAGKYLTYFVVCLQVLALAKRMLRRKEKESIIDAAYNRYAFHDTGLPRWFTDDERKHMR